MKPVKPIVTPRTPLNFNGEPNQLMTTFYPGDLDKISYKSQYQLTNDTIMAHRLLEWHKVFQQLIEWGADPSMTPAQQAEWKVSAQHLLAKSEEFV